MVEYNSEERKMSKEEKVLLMTNLRNFMTCEGAAVACAKGRDALCFVWFIMEQILVPALNTCTETLREGSELAKTLFLQGLLDIYQSKPLRLKVEGVRTCGIRTLENDRRHPKILKQGA